MKTKFSTLTFVIETGTSNLRKTETVNFLENRIFNHMYSANATEKPNGTKNRKELLKRTTASGLKEVQINFLLWFVIQNGPFPFVFNQLKRNVTMRSCTVLPRICRNYYLKTTQYARLRNELFFNPLINLRIRNKNDWRELPTPMVVKQNIIAPKKNHFQKCNTRENAKTITY